MKNEPARLQCSADAPGLFFFGGFLLTRSSACHLSWGCGFLVGSRELMRKATVTPTTVSDTRAAA